MPKNKDYSRTKSTDGSVTLTRRDSPAGKRASRLAHESGGKFTAAQMGGAQGYNTIAAERSGKGGGQRHFSAITRSESNRKSKPKR